MELQGNAHLQLVPPKVRRLVPSESGSVIWHCHETGCPISVQARYESLAAYDIARHWTESHDPKDAA